MTQSAGSSVSISLADRISRCRTSTPIFERARRFNSLPGRLRLSTPIILRPSRAASRPSAIVLPANPHTPVRTIFMLRGIKCWRAAQCNARLSDHSGATKVGANATLSYASAVCHVHYSVPFPPCFVIPRQRRRRGTSHSHRSTQAIPRYRRQSVPVRIPLLKRSLCF